MTVFYSKNRRPTNDVEIFGKKPGAHVDLFRVGWRQCAQQAGNLSAVEIAADSPLAETC